MTGPDSEGLQADPAEYFFDDGGYGSDSDMPDPSPVPSVGVVPVEVPEEAEFDFTLTTTIAEAVLNGPGEWIGSGVDLAALASLIREKAKPLIAARVRAEVRQPAANTKDAWFALCHAVATGTDLARENARADYDAAVRAEERQRAEIDVLRRVVADVEAQYPMMREHDALSDWSLGVTWMLDRLTSIADDLAAGSAVPVATPRGRTAHDATVAAQTLMGVVGEIDDRDAAELVTRRAMEFEDEARSLPAPVATPTEPGTWTCRCGAVVGTDGDSIQGHIADAHSDDCGDCRQELGVPSAPAEQDGQR